MPINNDVIKANRKYEGQTCAICKKEIFLGDLIHICPNCQSINHEECWENEGGCNNFSCNSLSNKKNTSLNTQNFNDSLNLYNSQQSNNVIQTDSMSQDMVTCRYCREPILRGAKKCRHCGEYQREADKRSAYGDDTLSITDILSIVCCPGFIGIIVGTVYCSKYEVERGVKILKYSIIWSTILSIFNFIIQIIKLLPFFLR